MNPAFFALFILAQAARLPGGDRAQLLPLAERLHEDVKQLATETERVYGGLDRNRGVPRLVLALQDDMSAFRTTLRRNRPIDLAAELETLRSTLIQTQDRVDARETPDPRLSEAVRAALTTLDRAERQAASLGHKTGKAAARVELGRQLEIDDVPAVPEKPSSEQAIALAHELHRHLLQAEQMAPSGRMPETFTQLAFRAYAFHNDMRDGPLNERDARHRVDQIVRDFEKVDRELDRGALPAEAQEEWREAARVVTRLRETLP